MNNNKGFTLLEILIVIAIIGILAAVILVSVKRVREKAYYMRATSEFKSLATAIEFYREANGDYPPDASRDLPSGLEAYLAGDKIGAWPKAPWPGSVYDWENWNDPNTGQKIYQISIRFCPIGGQLNDCRFPDESWAKNFGVNSAVYYCISGSCRSHISEPVTYPGYCVNCKTQPSGN